MAGAPGGMPDMSVEPPRQAIARPLLSFAASGGLGGLATGSRLEAEGAAAAGPAEEAPRRPQRRLCRRRSVDVGQGARVLEVPGRVSRERPRRRRQGSNGSTRVREREDGRSALRGQQRPSAPRGHALLTKATSASSRDDGGHYSRGHQGVGQGASRRPLCDVAADGYIESVKTTRLPPLWTHEAGPGAAARGRQYCPSEAAMASRLPCPSRRCCRRRRLRPH